VSRTIAAATTTTTAALTGVELFYGTSTASPPANNRGWYADFSGTSERVAVDPTLFRGVAAINSSIPGGDPCVGAGNFNQYRLNPFSGVSFPSTIITASPSVTSNVVGAGYVGSAVGLAEGDATWSGRDASGRYVVSDTIVTISAGANGVNSARTTVSKAAGRMSWREIKNFQ
jgi:Tfp pilus tip-associated adhesin PilY1